MDWCRTLDSLLPEDQDQVGVLEAGIAKRDLLDYEINSSVVEGVGVDLLAMGRPEGPGCYCAANNMLRAIIDAIADSYPWVVIDNEAGLEHLSRRTTRDVDMLLIVSDATVRGIITAGRLNAGSPTFGELAELDSIAAVVIGGAELRAAIDEHGLDLLAVLPDDPLVAAFDAIGRPILQLPDDSPLNVAMAPVVATVLDQIKGKEAAGAHHR